MRIVLLLAAIVLFGCQSPHSTPSLGSLAGIVHLEGGGDLTGVDIWLDGTAYRTYAKADGSYELNKIPVGNYTVGVAMAGYMPEFTATTITVGGYSLVNATLSVMTGSPASVELTETDGERSWGYSPLTDISLPRLVALNYDVPAGGADVYYLMTNTLTQSGRVFAGAGDLSASRHLAKPSPAIADTHRKLARLSAQLQGSGSAPVPRATSPAPTNYSVGAKTTFKDVYWSTNQSSTLRKIVTNGSHSLYVWVADAAWGKNPSANTSAPSSASMGMSHGVTQAMVNALADRFLASSGTNDIYHWVTGIFGAEWPTSGVPTGGDGKFVNSGGQVHIFLANLNPQGTNGGVVMGYFWNGNNYLSSWPGASSSNQKVLFAMDASSLADPADKQGNSSTWAIEDYWPAEIVSTLSHEFQHMIHFYEKQVTHGIETPTDTWIDEMSAQVSEDLVADKLDLPGPRGIIAMDDGTAQNVEGRLPLFNYWHEVLPLTAWDYDNVLPYYSNSYAFGAWLVRNYGGPELFHNIVASTATNYQAVLGAVQSVDSSATWPSLVRDWGLATFLGSGGNRQGLNYQASNGEAFTWTYGSFDYNAGSINPWNYRFIDDNFNTTDGPWVYRDGVLNSSRSVAPGGTYFHWAGRQSVGTKNVTVALPSSVVLTLVLEP